MKVLTEDNATTLRVMNEVLRENNLDNIKVYWKQTDSEISLRIRLPEIKGELENVILNRNFRNSKYSFSELVSQLNMENTYILNHMKERYSKFLEEKEDLIIEKSGKKITRKMKEDREYMKKIAK